MRERVLDQLRVSTGISRTDYWRPNGAFCLTENYQTDWVNGSYSHMIDAGTKYTDEIRTRYLEHHRLEIESFPIDVRNTFDSFTCGKWTSYHMYGRLGPGYTILGNPWVIDAAGIQTALFEAFRYFESGCAPQETLLANFAWELPDVKQLWPTFRNLITGRGKGKHVEVRAVKNVSSVYLGVNFGILPLIGDLIKIYERLTSLDDHITWLRKNSGQIVKVEFKKGLPTPTQSTLPARPTSAPGGSGGYWRNVTELRSGFKAWALITYDVSALTDLQLKLKTLLRSFGLNNPAAVVWEWLPYSFVVDWVAKVGDIFNRLEKPIILPCTFHDCGYGVWTESIIEDMYTTWGKTSCIRRTRTRGYSRRPGLPIDISALQIDTPTAKQLSLGLALLVQKF